MDPWYTKERSHIKKFKKIYQVPGFPKTVFGNYYGDLRQRIVLCFDFIQTINYKRTCRTFDGENFQEIAGAAYFHNWIRFGNYKGNPIAIGDAYEGRVPEPPYEVIQVMSLLKSFQELLVRATIKLKYWILTVKQTVVITGQKVADGHLDSGRTFQVIYDENSFFSYYGYSIISEADRVITFGGYSHLTSPKILDEVTQYKDDEWTLLGTSFTDWIWFPTN